MNGPELRFLGQRIVVKNSDRASPADQALTEEVLALVSSRLSAAEKRAKLPKNPQHIALTALLDLAEEYILSKKRLRAFQAEVGARADAIREAIGTEPRSS